MRSLIRTSLVMALIAAMLNLPAMAVERPLAVVVASSSGYLGKTQAIAGTNVYAGDGLYTDSNGSLRMKVGTAQLALLSLSSVALQRGAGDTEARLNSGSISFSVTPTDPVEIATSIATIRAATSPAQGRVTVTSPTTLTVSSSGGSLIVSGFNGEEKTILEGQTYNVRFVPDPAEPAGSPASAPPAAYHPGHGALIITIAAVAVTGVVTYALYHHFQNESPSKVGP